MYYTFAETPAGTMLCTHDGNVLTGLYWKVFARTPLPAANWIEDKTKFAEVFAQLHEYFAGKRTIFDVLYKATGTEFQMSVWRELEKIPFGEISSYQKIAHAVGRPKAVRAVGTAIGSNPISIVIPCHRVLSSGGKITGYAGGLTSKAILLRGEKAACTDIARFLDTV